MQFNVAITLSRRCYSSSSTEPTASSASTTVAKLLDSGPRSGNVVVNGFIRTIRKQSKHAFAAVGDGTSLKALQALLRPDQAKMYVQPSLSVINDTVIRSSPWLIRHLLVSRLSTGTAVTLIGSWRASPNPRVQANELHVEELRILGTSDPVRDISQC